MKKSHEALRNQVSMDNLVAKAREAFSQLPDPRGSGCKYQLDDVMIGALAMFVLKYPSLLQFEDQTLSERANLHQIFGINEICSDAQMRSILDQVSPEYVRQLYPQYFDLLKQTGIVSEYAHYHKQLIVSIDGVEHFHSTKIHCDGCLRKRHSNGVMSYSHSMLAAVLVHPDKREVFPLAAEPMTKQDGSNKNDCERTAAKRILNWLIAHYADQNLLLVEDALYAHAPHLRRIVKQGWNFVVSVKPGSHKALFRLFETRRQNKAVRYYAYQEDGLTHRFWYAKNMPLNDSAADFRINVLHYEQQDTKGKIRKFTWATSLKPNKANVTKIMRIGRSRWKIENETFNTLKNLGYHFEHNYGHGFKHLATVLALLMLLAFLMDQIFQKTNQVFNQVWQAARTKAKLWNVIRAAFTIQVFNSFNELYHELASQFEIQLE